MQSFAHLDTCQVLRSHLSIVGRGSDTSADVLLLGDAGVVVGVRFGEAGAGRGAAVVAGGAVSEFGQAVSTFNSKVRGWNSQINAAADREEAQEVYERLRSGLHHRGEHAE